MITTTLDDSPVARGNRLKKVRKLSGLSAEELAIRIGYSRQTISYWENAIHGGLSHKGAQKVVVALREASVYCDANWLLYGVGHIGGWMNTQINPEFPSKQGWSLAENEHLLSSHRLPSSIFEEIELFKKNNINAVVLQLTENISPLREAGDWVGGCLEPIHTKLFNKICIVPLKGKLAIKYLKQNNQPNVVDLYPPSETTQASFSVIHIEQHILEKAACITRLWKL